ncbi:hypothetical protein D3C87_355730 [compost metagenome]
MRATRESASTLKVELSNLRSKAPDLAIIVLEGKDDVGVFDTWIKRAAHDFMWEPFVTQRKKSSLHLRSILSRDLTGLRRRVFFIVDHDYDGLGGQLPDTDVYVLPGHSIENFIATPKALESFLRSTLQLHSRPDLREKALTLFSKHMDSLCELLIDPCSTLWAARSSGATMIEAKENLIGRLFISSSQLGLKDGCTLDDLISYTGEISSTLKLEGIEFLRQNGALRWIRGKYLMAFFEQMCQILHADLTSKSSSIFGETLSIRLEAGSTSKARLASAVDLPSGLASKIEEWRRV